MYMYITKIIFEDKDREDKSLAICSIILDDSLKLNKIRLFYKPCKGYYLVLPSKQDVFQEIQSLNEDTEILLPKSEKPYEEFFFPVRNSLYQGILEEVVRCFKEYKSSGKRSFKFNEYCREKHSICR